MLTNWMTLIAAHWKRGTRALFALALMCVLSIIAKAQSYQNTPFNPATTILPAGYNGYDPAAFINNYRYLALKEQQARLKGEFETTAAYEERLKELDAKNPLTSSTYAFSTVPTNVSYDADKQTFTLELKPHVAAENVNYLSVPLESGAKDIGHYDAENGFGAVFTVQESLFFSYNLWLLKTQATTVCALTVTVPIAEARDMRRNIRALAVVEPLPPFASVETKHTQPTFSEPSDNTIETGQIYGRLLGVRFYDSLTGRALASCP